MELMIPLSPQAGVPLYEQIYLYIRNEIKNGDLKIKDKLPSTRVLAKLLMVSRSTTQMAYDQLQAEGYIEAVPHKGYFISYTDQLVENGLSQKRIISPVIQKPASHPYLIDFTPSGIDLKSFPYSTWKKITKSILVDENREIFLAGDPKGEYNLRETLCKYLHSARGVNCHPDQIIIGAGNEYLLILLNFMLGSQSQYAMEQLTYVKAYRILKSLEANVYAVPFDHYGIDVDELEKSGANIAYVMPSHQYPTGIVMPVKRRQDLLNWANQDKGRYLIEDDYDSEFRYKGKPIPALQGMDQSDKVIYIGTFSRAVAPAIRVGYLVLPKTLLNTYQEQLSFYASTVSRIDQSILYHFITEGHYERHLNRMRAIYKNKREELLNALKSMSSDFIINGDDAGVHVLLTHKKGKSEEWLIERAKKSGVLVYGLSHNRIDSSDQDLVSSTVLLGYASLTKEQIVKGVDLLYQAWC